MYSIDTTLPDVTGEPVVVEKRDVVSFFTGLFDKILMMLDDLVKEAAKVVGEKRDVDSVDPARRPVKRVAPVIGLVGKNIDFEDQNNSFQNAFIPKAVQSLISKYIR